MPLPQADNRAFPGLRFWRLPGGRRLHKPNASGTTPRSRTGPFTRLADLEQATAAWVSWHNNDRIMHRLDRRTPAEYEAAYDQSTRDGQPADQAERERNPGCFTVWYLPSGHLEMEQDRAPNVLPDLHQLRRTPADQPRSDRQAIAAITTRSGLSAHIELDTTPTPPESKSPKNR
jgi:hypothetical protein